MSAARYLRSLGMDYVPGKDEVECEWCNASGKVYWDDLHGEASVCDECEGTGYLPSDPEPEDDLTPADPADVAAALAKWRK